MIIYICCSITISRAFKFEKAYIEHTWSARGRCRTTEKNGRINRQMRQLVGRTRRYCDKIFYISFRRTKNFSCPRRCARRALTYPHAGSRARKPTNTNVTTYVPLWTRESLWARERRTDSFRSRERIVIIIISPFGLPWLIRDDGVSCRPTDRNRCTATSHSPVSVG